MTGNREDFARVRHAQHCRRWNPQQYVGKLVTGKAGNLSDSWGRIFDELGLELVLKLKT